MCVYIYIYIYTYPQEWKDLGKLIENDKKMKEFMRSKAGVRGGGICDWVGFIVTQVVFLMTRLLR